MIKKYLIIAVLLFVFSISICCETESKARLLELEMKFQELKTELEKPQIGRYQIYQNTIVRADQFLLDTVTGRVWQKVVDPKTKKPWWNELYVDDRENTFTLEELLKEKKK